MIDTMRVPATRSGWAVLAAVLLALAGIGAGPTPGGADDWKYEVLHHRNGNTYKGLVSEETPSAVKFWEVKRPLGQPSRRLYHAWKRRDVVKIERLNAAQREELWKRIQAIDPVVKAQEQQQQLDNLQLEPLVWERDQRRQGWSYYSVYFILLSDAREDVVRQAALRLEQIYAAYGRFLPSRRSPTLARATTILLVDSKAEYEAILKSQRQTIRNPALYDPSRNQIICGSGLESLGAALEQVRKVKQEWKKEVANLKKRYKKGILPPAIQAQITQDEKQITRINRKNNRTFAIACQSLFQTLYHEAFHAYLENFVYPAKEARVPYWLNEGLAQIFETAILEAGGMRVEHVDPERLGRFRTLVKKNKSPDVAQLLRAGPREFHVSHDSEDRLADGYYLTSWALAYYLMIDKDLLSDRKKLDEYVTTLKKGTEPVAAFQQLVGKPLPQFQKEFRAYVDKLVKPSRK